MLLLLTSMRVLAFMSLMWRVKVRANVKIWSVASEHAKRTDVMKFMPTEP